MSYTPPAGNAVNFDFAAAYTPPAGNDTEFAFGAGAAATSRRRMSLM